jgi:hypothetical protein
MIFSSGDTLMSDADSILGKRPAEQEEEASENSTRDIALRMGSTPEGKQKKGRCGGEMEGHADESFYLEATSHGAAGQLTGSCGATSQQQ